ncbi:MAG: TIM barrel protein [Deltaproteobacteria bacterium]|nr:TIM barrel protein [Deltaproteobacteria bacterium]
MNPKLAVCNIFPEVNKLRDFALNHGFSGIDWSFDMATLPDSPEQETEWVNSISVLAPIEVRYHCPFYRIDLGHEDPSKAKAAETTFCRIIRLVSRVKGQYLTMHIGLGRDSTEPLSWEATTDNLARVVQFGASHSVKVCLENLALGWTSRPDLFEKLVRRSGAAVTFDIGHAHASESVFSHHYDIEDFVTPHADLVFNAHVYHTEVPGIGHKPPERIEEIEDRLDLLQGIGCNWWVLEIREADGLLGMKKMIDSYLGRTVNSAEPRQPSVDD